MITNTKTAEELDIKRAEILELVRDAFRGTHRDIAVPEPKADVGLGVGDFDPGEFDPSWRGFIAQITVELRPTEVNYMETVAEHYVGKVE